MEAEAGGNIAEVLLAIPKFIYVETEAVGNIAEVQ